MREGRWLNAAAIVTWLICGLPQFVAIAQGGFGGWPAVVCVAAYVVYGAALFLLLEIVETRLARSRYGSIALTGIQIASALTVIAVSVWSRLGTNSTPALLVIIAATLPHLPLSRAWIWSIIIAL